MKNVMMILALVLVAQGAMAAGPCVAQRKACEAKGLKRGTGLWKCVADEAKSADNKACLEMIQSHKSLKMNPGGFPGPGTPMNGGTAPTTPTP